MGLFAAWCGLIYNDFMAIPLWAPWGTCYPIKEVKRHDGTEGLDYTRTPDCTYLIGIDPIWYLSRNLLTFVNSLKMKLSVIFGVAQMGLGVIMKGLNALYFDSKLDFVCEFIP